MRDIPLSKDQEDAFEVDVRNVSLEVYDQVLLKLFVVTAEVIIDTAGLLLGHETLIDHELAPGSVGGEHGHKGFARGVVNVFDEFSLKEFEEVKVAIEKLDLGEGSH